MKKILIACTALSLLAPAAAFAETAQPSAQVEKAPLHRAKAEHRQNKRHKPGEECQCKDKEQCQCKERGRKHKTAAEREAWKKEHKGEMKRHNMEHDKAAKGVAPAN